MSKKNLLNPRTPDPISSGVFHFYLAESERTGLLEYIDPEPAYLGHIATLVDLQSIRDAGLDLIVDSMHGAGGGYFSKLLSVLINAFPQF